MSGPKAPKDPTKKRSCIYVMLDQTVAGVRTQEGNYTDVNFMEGRLVTQIKNVSGDIDESITKQLEKCEGFLKVVHSIGVSITATEEADKKDTVKFRMQCYGKHDKYATGTNIVEECPCNGEEIQILMEDCGMNQQDDIVGAFHYDFQGPGKSAVVTLCLYLNDGYEVPEIKIDTPIDFDSNKYQEMIEDSLVSKGNPYRLKKAIEKAKAGEPVTIAYIGGSITQGAGSKPVNTKSYAYLSYRLFCQMFTDNDGANVTFVKAGIGGTPSELGMLRYENDVLRGATITPDVVIVEFAVNDEGDETQGVCYESLVRKILMAENKPAVILNFAVFMSEWNLQDRHIPVGRLYDLPMVSVKDAVVPQFIDGGVLTKRQFFYDIYHPTNDGHRVMADCLAHLFKVVDHDQGQYQDISTEVEPVIGNTYEAVKFVDRSDFNEVVQLTQKGFDLFDKEIQSVEKDFDDFQTPVFAQNWMKDENQEDAYLEFVITCKNIVIVTKDSGDAIFGKGDVYVDGKLAITSDPSIVGWNHCNAQIILEADQVSQHVVRIQMHSGDENKRFTLLGIGYTLS